MGIQELGSIGEFIASIGVLITLIFLAFQMRQNTNALKLNTAGSVTEELQQVFSLLASTPELAEIFVTAAREPTLQGAERVRFNTFIHNLVRVYENAFLQWRAGVIDPAHWEGMARMMIDVTSMAAFQTYWQDRKHWVSDDFQEYMESEVVSAPPKTGAPVPGDY